MQFQDAHDALVYIAGHADMARTLANDKGRLTALDNISRAAHYLLDTKIEKPEFPMGEFPNWHEYTHDMTAENLRIPDDWDRDGEAPEETERDDEPEPVTIIRNMDDADAYLRK